jgi:alanyl-tRNA synthetase
MGLLVVVALIVAGSGVTAVAAEDPTEQVRALQMQNELYKKTIERLQEEIKKLKTEPAQVELEAMRQELNSAKEQIAKLEQELKAAKPTKESGQKITDRDLTPKSVKDANFVGAELLLDGYVVHTAAEKGEFVAIVVAKGTEGLSRNLLVLRTEGEVRYQVQIRLGGELGAKLQPEDISRRFQGTIKKVELMKGDMYVGVTRHARPQIIKGGTLIVVTLERATWQ